MFLILIGFCAAMVVYFAWLFWAEVGTATREESLQSLIDDAKAAQRSLWVICSKCEMLNAAAGAPDKVQEFLWVLRTKHDSGVDLRLWTKGPISPELDGLRRDGTIRVYRLPQYFPFEGRIIDGYTVHRYIHADGDLYSPGNFARGKAREEAEELSDSLAQAGCPPFEVGGDSAVHSQAAA